MTIVVRISPNWLGLVQTDIITGTIVTNSTKDITSVRSYAASYDNDSKLISREGGIVNVPELTPALTSPFYDKRCKYTET